MEDERRQELRNRLRKKINAKREVRRKCEVKSSQVESLMSYIKNNGIDMNSHLTTTHLEEISKIISLREIQSLMTRLEDKPEVSDNFKHFLKKLEASNFP
jgi:uncharacterized Zn finger protein